MRSSVDIRSEPYLLLLPYFSGAISIVFSLTVFYSFVRLRNNHRKVVNNDVYRERSSCQRRSSWEKERSWLVQGQPAAVDGLRERSRWGVPFADARQVGLGQLRRRQRLRPRWHSAQGQSCVPGKSRRWLGEKDSDEACVNNRIWGFGAADYRCESWASSLSSFANTNSWFFH